MKTKAILNILIVFFLFSMGFVAGCGDERPIPGDKVLTVYNSNLEETKELAPLDTMYVKVSALRPGKYYEVSVKDSDGKIISKIEEMTDDEGVIGPAALWYDVGLKNVSGVPTVEIPDDLDIMTFRINVKSISDDYTNFYQDMWVRYKNTDIDINPKPVVYSGYMDNGTFKFSNAFDETGTKQEDGTTASIKTKVYVKAETVPEKIGNTAITKVDFYIMPFIGGIMEDGARLQKQTDDEIFIGPVAADVVDGKVAAKMLWDLDGADKLINPGQDTMAYTIVMDVDRDGIYDAGMDTDSDGLIDSYVDGVDSLGVPGFVVMNTPANDTFVTVKDGTEDDSNITNSIQETGSQTLYINIDNLCFTGAVPASIKIHLVDSAAELSDGDVIPGDIRSNVNNDAAVNASSSADGKYLPFVADKALISNVPGSVNEAPDVAADKKYDIVADMDGDGTFDEGDGDIFLEDYITVFYVAANPEYKTYSDSAGTTPSIYFDESGTENGSSVVYLKPENQAGSYDAYVIKSKAWTLNDYISGSVVNKTGTGNGVLKLWDLNAEYKVINPDTDNNTYNIVLDNNQNGVYDAGDDIVSVVILNTEANSYPRVSYVNIASGGVFENTYAQHWTLYSEYCDYRDIFSVNAYETNSRSGYGVKAVFNPYFNWWGNEPQIPVESLYYGLYVDVYVVDKSRFDLSRFGHANELNDDVDVRGRHSTLSVQPSCYNGSGLMTIWRAPLSEGEYYVIVDVNRNGRIDEGVDIIDAANKQNETILDNPDIAGFKVED